LTSSNIRKRDGTNEQVPKLIATNHQGIDATSSSGLERFEMRGLHSLLLLELLTSCSSVREVDFDFDFLLSLSSFGFSVTIY
jgi:hypothetical protein